MGLLENARYASIERGYDYYKRGNVISFKQTSENEYEGKVSGSAKKPYDVHIDIIHIKKSFCNCPFVEGNREVCTHKIAIYFSAFPEKAEEYYKSLKSYDEPEFDDDYDNDYFDEDDEDDEDDEFDEDFREVVCDILNHRISKMTKSEAQSALYDIIESAPEWMLRDFVNNWI